MSGAVYNVIVLRYSWIAVDSDVRTALRLKSTTAAITLGSTRKIQTRRG